LKPRARRAIRAERVKMEIETFGNGYTVFYQGDEIYFDTYDEAMEFVKGVAK